MLKADFLEDVGDGVAYRRSRREGEVDDAERHAKALRRLLRDKLPDAGYLEGCLLYGLAKDFERNAAAGAAEHVVHDSRPRDAHVYDDVALGDAMERPCHERIVVRGVAEDDELGAANRIAALRLCRGLLHDLAHESYGVHVDTRLGRADVD